MNKNSEFYKKQKEKAREKAFLDVKALFELARTVFPKSKILANKNVKKARKLAMKHKLRLPRELKRSFCKNCYSLLVPSINLRVRLSGNKVIYYCLECKKYMRFPYVREKKKSKK